MLAFVSRNSSVLYYQILSILTLQTKPQSQNRFLYLLVVHTLRLLYPHFHRSLEKFSQVSLVIMVEMYKYLFLFVDSLSQNSSRTFLQILSSKIIFPESRAAILVCFLIYFFRILERRSGSLKFSSNICLSFLIGLSLEFSLSSVLPEPWNPLLNPGPLHLVLPLFVPYCLNVPVKSGPLGPFSISSKTISYLVGLQVALSSPSTMVSSAVSLLVGLAVHCTRLATLTAPAVLGDLSDSLLGWLVMSSPPPAASPTAPMGATLEIQRTQQAEAMEQQLLRARARQFQVRVSVGDLPLTSHLQPGGRQMRLEEFWNQNQGGRGGQRQPPAAAVIQPSPVMVQVTPCEALTSYITHDLTGSDRHGFSQAEGGAGLGQDQQRPRPGHQHPPE